MAAGNTLVTLGPYDGTPPAATFATLDTIAGASTPAEVIPVLDFDDTTVEFMDFYCYLPRHYGGGGLSVYIIFSAAEAASDVVAWEAAIRRIPDDAEDLDTTAHTYAYNSSGDVTAPSVIGETARATITFTDGADMDSLAAGEPFVLRVKRVAPGGTDVTGDASIHAIEIRETP